MNAFGRPRIRRGHIFAVLIVLVIGVAVSYSSRGKRLEVQVTSPTYEDLESTVATGGTVVPLMEFPARANFAGIVTNIHVQLGQKVRPGQLLLTMKDQYALARLETARSALAAARLSEQNAESNGSPEDRIGFASDLRKAQQEKQAAVAALDVLKELRQRGSVSEAEVAAGEQRMQAANENLQALEQRDRKRYTPEDLHALKVKLEAAKAS